MRTRFCAPAKVHRKLVLIVPACSSVLQKYYPCYNLSMQHHLSFKITGYLMAPHEWLRLGAYQLIGKRSQYRWGQHQAVQTEKLSARQQFFCLLFPLAIGTMTALALATLWAFSFSSGDYPRRLPDYLWAAPLWHHALHLTWMLLLTYTLLFSFYDVLAAFCLWQQQRSRQ